MYRINLRTYRCSELPNWKLNDFVQPQVSLLQIDYRKAAQRARCKDKCPHKPTSPKKEEVILSSGGHQLNTQALGTDGLSVGIFPSRSGNRLQGTAFVVTRTTVRNQIERVIRFHSSSSSLALLWAVVGAGSKRLGRGNTSFGCRHDSK